MKKFSIIILTISIAVIGFVGISGFWLFSETLWRVLGYIIFIPTLLLPAVWWWENYFNKIFNKDK